MRILVYGAGVLGSLFAAWLQDAGEDVTVLARGRRAADLRTHGIVLESAETGEQSTTRVSVVETLAPDDRYDWILVLMRRNQVAEILPALAANPTPNVLFMTNNAAGPGAYIQALGRERVLLGFPGAGGTREGYVVRYAVAAERMQPTTLGELDGTITSRLEAIGEALVAAGFSIEFSPDMDAWLKTHVALVSPIANALYLAGGDNYRLAETRDGVVLLIRAVKEGFQVLRALGIPVIPKRYRVLAWLPEPLLVAWMRRGLATERAELMLARHANAARDEMKQLADEFRELVRASGVPTPAIDRLATYMDSAYPPLRAGSQELALNWRSIGVGMGMLAAVAVALRWWTRRRE